MLLLVLLKGSDFVKKDIKQLEIITWGGGTQSTALLLKMLKGEIADPKTGEIIKPDYIIFSDTKDEAEMTYAQIYKVQKYVKEKYNFDIVITSKNKVEKPIDELERMIKSGELEKYRSSKYVDLYQSHILMYKGLVKQVDVIPSWTRNKVNGKVGKLGMKQCTVAFKIDQILKELRKLEGVRQFSYRTYKLNMYIGFTVDEIGRIKPNPQSYVENKFPLVDINMTKQGAIDYVEKELGFVPKSSVCNVCYANDFKKCYDIYKTDKNGWKRIVELDKVMANKPEDHHIRDDVFLYKWQADMNIRLENVDMEELYKKELDKPEQLSIFDIEQKGACMGGCFI